MRRCRSHSNLQRSTWRVADPATRALGCVDRRKVQVMQREEETATREQITEELNVLEQLANLPTLFDDAIPFFPRERDYHPFWTKNREITDLFRDGGLRYEDRARLWNRKHALCGRVRELQDRAR